MNVTFFSTQPYDRDSFLSHNQDKGLEFLFLEEKLTVQTTALLEQNSVVCAFVNDHLDAEVLEHLREKNVSLIALRCAGFNNVDLKAAAKLNIKVVRVPAYSPHAVAEHALAMIMALNRKTHKAYNRIREQNFSLTGLLGFDLFGKTVGIIGTGNIGVVFATIMKGLGCKVIAFDPYPNETITKLGAAYVTLDELFATADIISLHCPLTKDTRYIISTESIETMKPGVMLINTSRGGLLDTQATISGLKSGKIGSLGVDVYEQEENLFFQNLSEQIIADDVIARLMTFPNVLITAHQGFFTKEALDQIARTTLTSINQFLKGESLTNEVTA